MSDQTLTAISLVAAIISAACALGSAALVYSYNRQSDRTATRDATDAVFREWWSDELQLLRRYFFREFLPDHRAKLLGKGMKDIESVIKDDHGRATKLCYFFDRLGWLGAAGLVDVDYLLAPMQHVLRRTWLVMEELIDYERQSIPGQHIDPVFQFGFEWIYRRSGKRNKHQARLVGRRFALPRLFSDPQLAQLRIDIDEDEARFVQELGQILAGPPPDGLAPDHGRDPGQAARTESGGDRPSANSTTSIGLMDEKPRPKPARSTREQSRRRPPIVENGPR